MFDFAWSEFALIAVVAMIAIGPKDMPVAIRAVKGWIVKARRMAAEFQTHVDEMVREADLGDVRSSINELRNFDVRGAVMAAVDSDGSIRSALKENPLAPAVAATTATSVEEIAVSEPAATEIAPPEPEPEPEPIAAPRRPEAPAFVPPNFVLPLAAGNAGEPEPPAFIPPEIVQQRLTRSL